MSFDKAQFIKDFERVNGKTNKGQTSSAPVVVQPRVATPEEIAQQQNYAQMQALFARQNTQNEIADVNKQINNLLAVQGRDNQQRQQLNNLVEQQKMLNKQLGNPTALSRAKLSGKAIAKTVAGSPVAAADMFAQVTTDPVELEIQNLERKADLGVLDEAGLARLAQLKPQQYTKALDTSGWGFKQVQDAQKLQEQASKGFDNGEQIAYDIAMSIGTNLATLPSNLVVPGASLALMGTQATAGKALDVAENGGSAGEAFGRGLASGAIEAATELVSLKGLADIFKGNSGKAVIENTLAKLITSGKLSPVLVNAVQQSLTEGGEEVASAIANFAMDKAVGDPNAQLTAEDLVLAFFGGAVSGGVLGTGANIAGNVTRNLSKNVENSTETAINSTENAINSTENVAKSTEIETADRKALEDEVKRIVGIDTRTESEKVADTENERVALAEEMANIAGAKQEDVDRVRQSAEENIAEAKAKESLESAVELINYIGKEADIYSDSSDRAAAYNTAKRIGINLAHSDTTAMGRAVHEVGHDKTQSEQWQNYTAALDKLIATDGRLVKLMEDIDYAYRNSEDAEVRASVSFEDGTIDNAKVRNEQYLKLTEIMLPNIAKRDKQLLDAIKKDRNVLDNLLDFIRGIKNKVSIKLTRSEAAMLDEAERQLVNLLRSEGEQTEGKQYSYGDNLLGNSGKGFSVAMDSNGNKLTEKQADYFKNSKIRDDKGNLKVLYHGTTHFGEITKFKSGKSGYLGPAIYLAENKTYAERYANAMGPGNGAMYEVYANATNPLIVSSNNPTKEILNAIYGSDKIYNKRKEKQSFDTNLITKADIKKLQEKGYDSIYWDFKYDPELAVFDSSQIKRTDNKNPTSVLDIRYSLQSDIDTNEYWGENSKSRAVERHAVNEFASAVADLLGVEFKDKNEILKKQAWKIADAAKKTGVFDTHQMIDFFENAYNLGNQETGNLDERNKQLKKELHNLGIKPLKGREYFDFVQKYKGKIMFNRNGLDIDIAYKQLAENYPEWFSEDIVNPYDMMNRIGEVYDSIQGKKVSNKEFFGQDAEEFKSLAVQQYQNIVDNFIDTMNSVSRYQLALAEQKKQDEAAAKKVYTLEDVKAARELAQPLMKEIARMDRKNLFTAEDRNRLNDLLELTHPADIERMQESLRATNPLAEDIIAMYEKKKMLEAVKKPIYEYNKQRKARLKSQFLDILQTSDSWKDKGSGLAYMNNTFERNIDDIVTDKKAAEKLKDILPRQIHKHVADATRYKNKLRDKIRGFDIDTTKTYNIEVQAAGELLKGEATEADLIQMYGEGIVTKQYLDKIGANTKKIVETADKFREIYNELFEKINEAYVTNGYAPMEYRQDYFPHFFDETGDTLLNKVGAFLGIDAKNMLPTEIAGRTHEFSPGRQWNSHALQRKGEKTDYNVLKGFDNYIEAAANIIHLTEDIQNLRAFENAIRYKYSDEGMKAELDAIDALPISEAEKQEQRERILKTENRNTKLNNFVVWEHEYTNLLAGKKSKADRWIEDMFGRRFYTVAKNVENRVAANMIAGNISSALTNFIPLTQLTAEVDGRYIVTAMSDTIKNIKNNDGIVEMSDFLTNRFGSEMLSLTTMQKLANKAGAPMALVDEFTANVVTRARYLQNVDKGGMDSASAMKDADEYAASLMADRSKGALPVIFESKNPLIKLFTMFQVEQANQLNYLFKDLPRKKQEKAKDWMIWALIKLGVFSALYNWLFEQLAGRKPAFSPVDMVVDTSKDIAQVAKGEMKASAALSNSFVRTMENLPYASSVLAVTGLSEDAGRIPVSGALPDFSQLAYLMDRDVSAEKKKAVAMKELTKPALYLGAPFAGGAAKKVVDTAVLYGKNKGVQYSIQSDGTRKVQFANDPSVGAVAQAAAFGKWASKPAQEYIDSGFKGLTKGQTENFELYKSWGMSNKEAFAKAKESKAMTDKQVSDMQALTKAGMSENDAYILATTYKKKADTDNNNSLKTKEAMAYIETLDLTKEQKAILFSCMCPTAKNNPYK